MQQNTLFVCKKFRKEMLDKDFFRGILKYESDEAEKTRLRSQRESAIGGRRIDTDRSIWSAECAPNGFSVGCNGSYPLSYAGCVSILGASFSIFGRGSKVAPRIPFVLAASIDAQGFFVFAPNSIRKERKADTLQGQYGKLSQYGNVSQKVPG